MTKTETRLYYSDRQIPLVYYGDPPREPILTVENYMKWYDIHVVRPDGGVSVVDHDLIAEAWCDHNFKPWICHQLAHELGYEWHDESLEMVIGRYVTECEEIPWYCTSQEPDVGYVYLLYRVDSIPMGALCEDQHTLVCAGTRLDEVKRFFRSHIRHGQPIELHRVIDGRDASTTCTKLDRPANSDSGRTVPPQ